MVFRPTNFSGTWISPGAECDSPSPSGEGRGEGEARPCVSFHPNTSEVGIILPSHDSSIVAVIGIYLEFGV